MFCTNCGAQVPEGCAFCTRCGKPIAAPAQASGAPVSNPTPAPNPYPANDQAPVYYQQQATQQAPAFNRQPVNYQASPYQAAQAYGYGAAPGGALRGTGNKTFALLAALLLVLGAIMALVKNFAVKVKASYGGASAGGSYEFNLSDMQMSWVMIVILILNVVAIGLLLLAAFRKLPDHPGVYGSAGAVAITGAVVFIVAWIVKGSEVRDGMAGVGSQMLSYLGVSAKVTFAPSVAGWILLVSQISAAILAFLQIKKNGKTI